MNNISRLTEAMTGIDDALISGAMVEKSASRRPGRLKYLAVAACLLFAVTAGVIGISQRQALPVAPADEYSDTEVGGCGEFVTVDPEPSVIWTEEELRGSQFGELFPTVIPEGYEVKGDIALIGDTIVAATLQKGVYYKTRSTIDIKIADKSWFEDELNTNRKNGGVYFECNGLGAVYTMTEGEDLSALTSAVMSASCFTDREIAEIPHSYDSLEVSTFCEHKYYNVAHSGEPKLYQFQHADMAGYVCTATFEEYWHDMICADCGEVFGGYTKVCAEHHSNRDDFIVTQVDEKGFSHGYFGTCPYEIGGVCYISEFESFRSFAQDVEEFFTYGYPLHWEDTVIELREMIAAGIYELDENGFVKPWNGYRVAFDSSQLRFYSTDEEVYLCIIRWYDDDGNAVYEVQRDDPEAFADKTIVWRSDQN